jgi:hypothetical protein
MKINQKNSFKIPPLLSPEWIEIKPIFYNFNDLFVNRHQCLIVLKFKIPLLYHLQVLITCGV